MNAQKPQELIVKHPAESAVVQVIQISQAFLQQQYLPYVAGLLQAYALQHCKTPQRFKFLPPLFRRSAPKTHLEACQETDIAGFSVYVWNINYSLELARLLKEENPQRWIIFGGPHVPDHAEEFLREHPFIDVVVHGEGEPAFLELLESWPHGQWQGIAGISWLDAQGQFQYQPPMPRMRDLDCIPSPYLTDIFEPLLKTYPTEDWIVLWETNRGCPFSCAFCDWGSATASKVNRFGMERLLAEIDWFARKKIHTVYCCDANYGMLPRDVELTDEIVAANQQSQAPKVFYIQNTKNVTERAYEIQEKISRAGLNQAVTLSLQSVTPAVLEAIKRENISLDSYRELQQRFRANHVQTYTDMLVGLPGETFETFVTSVNQVITEGQHDLIRFYSVYVLPNAPMAQPEYRQEHGLETVTTLYAEPFSPVGGKAGDIAEYQELLIAHRNMSREDWRRCRTMAWWAEILYFNRKILQMPLLLLQRLSGASLGEIFQHYLEGPWPETTVLKQFREFFSKHSKDIQAGGSELCPIIVPEKGEIWMNVEDNLFEGLSQRQAWPAFFRDHQIVMQAWLQSRGQMQYAPVIMEAVETSAQLLQTQVFNQPFAKPVSSNFWEVYTSALQGEDLQLKPEGQVLIRDLNGAPDHLRVQKAATAGPQQLWQMHDALNLRVM